MYCIHSKKLVILQKPFFLIGQDIHTNAVNEPQLWFRRFKKGNYDISDKTRRGIRSTVNEEILKETSELAPPESNKDLMQKFHDQLSTDISSELGKLAQWEFRLLVIFSLETEQKLPSFAAIFSSGMKTFHFCIDFFFLQVIKKDFTCHPKTKKVVAIRESLQYRHQKQDFI